MLVGVQGDRSCYTRPRLDRALKIQRPLIRLLSSSRPAVAPGCSAMPYGRQGQLGSLVSWYWHHSGLQQTASHTLHRNCLPSFRHLSSKASLDNLPGKASAADFDTLSSSTSAPSFSTAAGTKSETPSPGSKWNGHSTQEQFMYKDECILVDNQDNITGHSSKYDAHRFTPQQPTGLLHRAFSVFLFREDNKLLLQQRAPSKITFPNVWTNTCCSHPLHGFEPSEIDASDAVSSGHVLGAKQAAIRKLHHELGIVGQQLPIDKFRYLTRLHYCAPDSVTYGDSAEWGEHEIDYILLIKCNVTVNQNPEEVQDTKYVTKDELKKMMDPKSGLLWSPWFRIIAENFLSAWWDDLDQALTTDKYVDTRTIHKI